MLQSFVVTLPFTIVEWHERTLLLSSGIIVNNFQGHLVSNEHFHRRSLARSPKCLASYHEEEEYSRLYCRSQMELPIQIKKMFKSRAQN